MYPRFLAIAFLIVVSAMTLGVGQPPKERSPVKTGQDYAFLFYNTNFAKGWTALPDTETEIQKLATELKDNYNFEVEPYVNLNLTTLRKRLAEINRRPFGPNDQVLFYFSSHGYYQAGSDRGYLIPTDGPASWNFGQGWLSYDELREYLSANTAKHVLVGLDACHSGSFGKRTKGVPTSLPWQKDADCETITRSSLKRKSRLYFSSGNKNERTAAQSEFLSRWLQCLRELPANGGYVVDHRELHNYVNTVSTSTPENGTFVGHDEGGGFVFVHKQACVPKVGPRAAADNAHWARVQREKTVMSTDEHIRLYGNCPHYSMALQLLNDGAANSRRTSARQEEVPEGMVAVPGGTFLMGDVIGVGREDELPVHSVSISPFEMGRYEVTFTEYDRFTADSGKAQAKDTWGRGRLPVINVSWFDAISYCNWLSEKQGFKPVYRLEDIKRQFVWENAKYYIPHRDDERIIIDWNADGYRLPTEAEWEYVASYVDGIRKARYGNGENELRRSEAKFNTLADVKTAIRASGKDQGKTLAVGSFNSPNNLGIYDLAGNVAEWTSDWHDTNYYISSDKMKNPKGPAQGDNRVYRGGGWDVHPVDCRTTARSAFWPKLRYDTVGFRLARSPRE